MEDEMQSYGQASLPGDVYSPSPQVLMRERIIYVFALILPFLGAIAACWLAWNCGLGVVDAGLFLILYVLSSLGIEMGYHRLFSHRAFKTTSVIRFLLALFGAWAVQGPITYWVAFHRRHHQFSDMEGDPHSPNLSGSGIRNRLAGLVFAHIGWFFYPERPNPARYAKDIYEDPIVIFTTKHYFLLQLSNLALPALIGGLASGSLWGALSGMIWGGLARIFLVQHMTYAINSICHVFGARPFRIDDKATNNYWLMLPSLGGSLHNSHHAFASTAKNSLSHWWELDIAWGVISFLSKFGLVWDAKVPSKPVLASKRAV
ncbi:MAG: fatty acid desaturase [Candidatus Kerfeldbacteria bacterium]|nr:fatty acid desaturase [Candidatus Kerfeldbacteria bacterium]